MLDVSSNKLRDCQQWDNGESICHALYCHDPVNSGCYGGSPGAADGTACGTNKVSHYRKTRQLLMLLIPHSVVLLFSYLTV